MAQPRGKNDPYAYGHLQLLFTFLRYVCDHDFEWSFLD